MAARRQTADFIASFGGEHRLLQDSPIQLDVWVALEAVHRGRQRDWVPLLITPHPDANAAQVAGALAERLRVLRRGRRPRSSDTPGEHLPVSVPGLVLAWMTLEEVAAAALPMTAWWRNLRETADPRRERVQQLIDWLLRPPAERTPGTEATAACEALLAKLDEPAPGAPCIRRIALDRTLATGAVEVASEATCTIKADAARRLFNVRCDRIRWAVIDSGISTLSGAFGEGEACRVDSAYDFSRLTEWLAKAQASDAPDPELVASIADTKQRRHAGFILAERAKAEAAARLRAADPADPAAMAMLAEAAIEAGLAAEEAGRLAKAEAEADALKLVEHLRLRQQEHRDFDWEMLEPVLEVCITTPPRRCNGRPHGHGTAVAGILAADAPALQGVCPDLRLIDLRVLSVIPRQGGDSEFIREFDVLAALKFLRFLNSRGAGMAVHGANLSLQTPHDVGAYGTGATLLCDEVDRTVNDGVVVVVAAGNDGHRVTADIKGREVGAYVGMSISDPGNAEEAITVGSTHRRDPHRYGVSYFSGRGPTGDGRRKPDLVAPGEKIPVLTITGGQSSEVDGTSFAAPHVSGAAAMLMARHPELIGKARRIKRILCESATDLGRTGDFQGAGLLDVLRAMQSV